MCPRQNGSVSSLFMSWGWAFGSNKALLPQKPCYPYQRCPSALPLPCSFRCSVGRCLSPSYKPFLRRSLSAILRFDFSPSDVLNGEATSIRSVVSESVLPEVLVAYNDALLKVFQIALMMVCLSIIEALGIEWNSMKPKK